MTDKTVATISVPVPTQNTAMPPGDLWSWIVATAAGTVATLLWLRRRTSRDSAEIAKDRAEENLVKTLREERDRAMADAREAWARRTADAEQIAGLKAENDYLKRDVDRLGKQVNEVQEQLAFVTAALRRIAPDFQLPAPPAPPQLI